jgi:hypothetical protein
MQTQIAVVCLPPLSPFYDRLFLQCHFSTGTIISPRSSMMDSLSVLVIQLNHSNKQLLVPGGIAS